MAVRQVGRADPRVPREPGKHIDQEAVEHAGNVVERDLAAGVAVFVRWRGPSLNLHTRSDMCGALVLTLLCE